MTICGAIGDVAVIAEDLNEATAYLEYAKYVPEFDEIVGRLSQVQDGVNAVSGGLSRAVNLCASIKSVSKIRNSIAVLSQLDDLRSDPEAAARAFGTLLSGVGELAQFLPPPANGFLVILRDAKDFFVTLRQQMQPEVHMREEGLREVIDNL
jgi:hypothetical protein